MPTLERPDAVRRFPSADSENSYHRTLVLRGSEGSNAIEGSRTTSSVSPSPPPVSPHTQVPDRKVRNIERRSYVSESYKSPQAPLRGPVIQSFEPSYFPPFTMHEESSPPWTRTSTGSASSDGVGSSHTSNNMPVRKILELSTAAIPDSVKGDKEIPLDSRSSHKWKHETSGLWFEVHVGKKQSSRASEKGEDQKTPRLRRATSENLLTSSDRTDEVESLSPSSPTPRSFTSAPRGFRSATMSTTNDDAEVRFEEPKEGLYCRTKRALGLKHGPIAGSRDEQNFPERSMTAGTGEALNRVSSQLREFKLRGRETNISDTASNLSIAAPSAITRWHHLQSLYSSSIHSSSSSLRSLARGYHRPVTTPDPESMYTGSDMNRYLAVELTDPGAPTFLPSEARRVDIPGQRQFRAYLESNAPSPYQTPSSTTSTPDSLKVEGSVRSAAPLLKPEKDLHNFLGLPRKTSNTEYFRMRQKLLGGDVGGDANETREQFVLTIPEHLPSSPMCPKHPKNKSKGKGVCVYHGRNVP